jgi:hypothetical protein
MTTITTEWSTFEWDGATRLRFVGAHSTPSGPHARKLGPYITDDGTPVCIVEAVKDAGGFFEIVPGSLVVDVGAEMRFVHADAGHPFPNYRGTFVVSVA